MPDGEEEGGNHGRPLPSRSSATPCARTAIGEVKWVGNEKVKLVSPEQLIRRIEFVKGGGRVVGRARRYHGGAQGGRNAAENFCKPWISTIAEEAGFEPASLSGPAVFGRPER